MTYRTLCEVLDEMRKCHKTHNYSYLLGLIEEAQSMANKMEAALEYGRDIKYLHKEEKELRKRIEELREKAKKLEKEAKEDTRLED